MKQAGSEFISSADSNSGCSIFPAGFSGRGWDCWVCCIIPIREEHSGRSSRVEFPHKIQKRGRAGSESWLSVCLEGESPSHLPGEFFFFVGARPNKVKKQPKISRAENTGAMSRGT